MKKLRSIFAVVFCFAISLFAVACNENVTPPTLTTYKITFVQDGQEDVVVEVELGKEIPADKIPEIVEKEGYTGVWEDVDYSALTGDIEVEVVYTANKYTVTYDANGGNVSAATLEVTYDSAYTLATPTKENYNFVAWLLDGKAFEMEGTWDIADDVTLKAEWAEKSKCSVVFVQPGFEPIEKTVYEGATLTDIPTPNQKAGYETIVWDRTDFSNITGNVVVNAVETPLTYTISYDVNGGSMENATQTVAYDSAVTVAEPTRGGYIFKGWYVVDGEGNQTSEKYTGGKWDRLSDLRLVAVWEENVNSNFGYTERY